MAGIKVRRTLDDRGFKKYMAFCESLKDGSNDALIDTFKYRFAVMEGRIVPEKRKRTLTESLAQFEEGVKNLVSAFLPHLDEEEQGVLGNFLSNMQEEIDKRFDRDGEDADDTDEETEDTEVCPECGKVGDECTCDDAAGKNDGCPEGECKVDGECVPCDKVEDKDSPEAKEECGEKPATECDSGTLEESVGLDDPDNDFRADMYPADDDYLRDLDFDARKPATSTEEISPEAGESYGKYDAMADELLRDAGFEDLTINNNGVRPENRKFFGS